MSGTIHLKQSIKGLKIKTLLLCLALFIFEMLFSILAASARIHQDMLKDMKNIPPAVQKMMGEGFIETMLKYGVIALGYLHPIMLVIFTLFIFISVSHMLTSEIVTGTIGFTLNKPVSRERIYLNLFLVIYPGLGLMAFSTFLSSYLGIILFHKGKNLPTAPFGELAWNLFLVMILVAGYIVIFAAISDSSKTLYVYGGISLLVFYILSMAAPLWKPLAYISPVSPFDYFKPMELMTGKPVGLIPSMVMIVFSVVMFAVGGFLFNKRDIASG